MTQDYKNTPKPGAPKSRAKPKAKPRPRASQNAAPVTPGWVWLLAGLLIGLFVALLVYLKDFSAASDTSDSAETPAKSTAQPASEPAEKPPAAHKPRFDFYNLLPEMEVLIPDQELATEREKEPAEKVVYYLQAASFLQFEDADRMRAQLALMNIESQIQRLIVNEHKTWHRVRIGPFKSARKMDKVRGRLRAKNIEPIVLKTKL